MENRIKLTEDENQNLKAVIEEIKTLLPLDEFDNVIIEPEHIQKILSKLN